MARKSPLDLAGRATNAAAQGCEATNTDRQRLQPGIEHTIAKIELLLENGERKEGLGCITCMSRTSVRVLLQTKSMGLCLMGQLWDDFILLFVCTWMDLLVFLG